MNINRVKQFWHALFSKLNENDFEFVKQHLDRVEQSLFFAMDRPTQTHSVRVAYTCLRLLPQQGVQKELIIRAALLHDIGKPANLITTLDRVCIVVINAIKPGLVKDIINSNHESRFRKVLTAHVNHPQNGAELAVNANLSADLVKLISEHHSPAQQGDSSELTILRQADELN